MCKCTSYPTYITLKCHWNNRSHLEAACIAIWSLRQESLYTWHDWWMLAPFFSSSSTTSQCPCWLAMNRGDPPVYSVKCRYVHNCMGQIPRGIWVIELLCLSVTKSPSFTYKCSIYSLLHVNRVCFYSWPVLSQRHAHQPLYTNRPC